MDTQTMAARIAEELAHVAFADATDFVRVVSRPNDAGELVQTVELADSREVPKEQRAAISSIKMGRYGIEVNFYDKFKALELLGRHLGMFRDKSSERESETGIAVLPQVQQLLEEDEDA